MKLPINVVKKHQKASDSAFKIFENTMKKLTKADVSIEKDIDAEQAKIDKAQANKDALGQIRTRNANFNKKLAEFIAE